MDKPSEESIAIKTNPWPSIVSGGLIIALGIGGFGVWAASAKLSAGAVAPAILVVESKRKDVQHLEGGIVSAIQVRNGDVVGQGDVLLSLDGTRANVSLELLNTQYLSTQSEISRLQAERDGLDKIVLPASIQSALDKGSSKISEIVSAQQKVFDARRRQFSGQAEILRSRVDQLGQQVEGLKAQETSTERQYRLIAEELEGLRILLKKGHTNKTRVLALERAMVELEGQKGNRDAELARIGVATGEAELEILQLREDLNAQVVNELREAQDRLFDLEERRKAALDLNNRLDIRAPIGGTIVELQVYTIGGVVEPGQSLMQIIPEGDRLTVEARIWPQDIDLVSPGMTAEVKFSSFSQRNMPTIFGRVEVVSADIISEPRSGLSYYLAEIMIPDSELAKLGDNELKPGMPSEVLIQAGEHTALEYLTQPIMDILARAFHDY